MHLQPFTLTCNGETLSALEAWPESLDILAPTVILMHGADLASKEPLEILAADIARRGVRALTFDFSGHGKSTGVLSELTLERRLEQAKGFIEAKAPQGRLVLIGFSMSAQTVADLLPTLRNRVEVIGLCAPVAYGSELHHAPFDAHFTASWREAKSWQHSVAFDHFALYNGRAALVLPEHDAIVPAGIAQRIEESLAKHADLRKLTLAGTEHDLAPWLAAHPDDRERLLDALFPQE